jgi:hypothetical protein
MLAGFECPTGLQFRPRAGSAARAAPAIQLLDAVPVASAARVEDPRVEDARFLTQTLLSDPGAIATVVTELEARVDERIAVWTPSLSTASRTELVSALLDGDDSITDITVRVLDAGFAASTTYLRWSASGRFSRAGFLNDDVLIEPSGRTIDVAGASVVAYVRGRPACMSCYYDSLAVLEQVLMDIGADGPGGPVR